MLVNIKTSTGKQVTTALLTDTLIKQLKQVNSDVVRCGLAEYYVIEKA